VHGEADRLNDVVLDACEERIAQALGDPEHNPHGDPIPSRSLHVTQDATLVVGWPKAGGQAANERVLDTMPETLPRLAEAGLVPGPQVTLVAVGETANGASRRIADRSVLVMRPRALARKPRVEPAQ
jgi:DtxR family transcriptional regulator, Mn-dependent transcriptional regulator